MRLLIITQAVDSKDPVLGFFHRWIEEFAGHAEHVHVLCLKEGTHALPPNVTVSSLGKERGASRLSIIRAFYRFIWSRRNEYDTVFVHMNPEYVVLGGSLWRILGKKIGLWYVHRRVDLKLRIAALFVHRIFTVSEQSCGVRSSKVRITGHGIDVNAYAMERTSAPRTILWLGRIDPVKRFHLLMAALQLLNEDGVDFKLNIYGTPTRGREGYMESIRTQFSDLEKTGKIVYLGGLAHENTPGAYASHDIFVNLTPSGSFDKTILEAMASGSLAVVANPLFKDIVDHDLFVQSDHVEAIAMAIKNALELPLEKAERERNSAREYVRSHHALPQLVGVILGELK